MKYTKLMLIGLLVTGSSIQAGAAAVGVGAGVGGALFGGTFLCPKESSQVKDLKAQVKKLKKQLKQAKKDS